MLHLFPYCHLRGWDKQKNGQKRWFFFSFRGKRREKVAKVEEEIAQDLLWPLFLKQLRQFQQSKEVPNSCSAEEAWSVTKHIMEIGKRTAAKTEPYFKPRHEQVQNLPSVPNPAPSSEKCYSNVVFCNFIRKHQVFCKRRCQKRERKLHKHWKQDRDNCTARLGLTPAAWGGSKGALQQHYPIPSTPAHSASLQGILLLQ